MYTVCRSYYKQKYGKSFREIRNFRAVCTDNYRSMKQINDILLYTRIWELRPLFTFSKSFTVELQPVAKMLRHSHKKRPFLLQIPPGHRSVRYNTDLPSPSHSKLFLQVLSLVLYCQQLTLIWGGGGITSTRSQMFMPKYDTVSQVLLQLVVSFKYYFKKQFPRLKFPKQRLQRHK